MEKIISPDASGKVKKCRGMTQAKDYSKYKFTLPEFLKVLATGTGALLFLGQLFYGSYLSGLMFLPLLFFYVKKQRREAAKRQRQQLQEQFKDALVLAGQAMEAGYSVENSFLESYEPLKERYGENACMVQELYLIKQGLHLNLKIEELFTDLANRSQLKDIRDFAIVFAQAKRGGGNLSYILGRTIQTIKEKIELQKEIRLMLSGRKYEQRIMSMVPIGIVAYISITSKGFFDIMYGNLLGVLIMTGCLAAYGGAFMLAERLMRIEV